MGLNLVTAADGEPIDLEQAKQHLKVDISDDDDVIFSMIAAARSHIEDITNRALLTQTWDYFIDECWPWQLDLDTYRHQRVIEVPKAPLASVSSITYVDSAGASQTLAADQYVVDGAGAIGRVYPAYGVTWPTVRCQRRAITVRFVAGYGAPAAVPEPLRQALKLLVGHLYANREPVGDSRYVELPLAVSSLISSYRVFF